MRNNVELKYDVEIPQKKNVRNEGIVRMILEFLNSGSQTAEVLPVERDPHIASKKRGSIATIISRKKLNCSVIFRDGRIFLVKKEPSVKG